MHALEGVRVLDLGTYLAGPFCATVLGEFGAEVIKVERPGSGDNLRRFGTDTACGDTLVWLSESRNKRSVTIDFADPRGLQLVRELIAGAGGCRRRSASWASSTTPSRRAPRKRSPTSTSSTWPSSPSTPPG